MHLQILRNALFDKWFIEERESSPKDIPVSSVCITTLRSIDIFYSTNEYLTK